MLTSTSTIKPKIGQIPLLFGLFLLSGFNSLLYQVAWQRMLGLFSGSDVRSVTIIVASYLLGLGLSNLWGGRLSDRLNNRACVRFYGFCNLGVAIFAVCSRFLFYDLLFLRFSYLAQSLGLMLTIVFVSLLIPTTLMGVSLPLLSKAINLDVEDAASRIGWLYGVNTLGAGLGTLVSGWYLVGTLGYENTVYLGATLSVIEGTIALMVASRFTGVKGTKKSQESRAVYPKGHKRPCGFKIRQGSGQTPRRRQAQGNADQDTRTKTVKSQELGVRVFDRHFKQWCVLVFLSGFVAISLEIIWFRVLDIALQSNAYTYAHLLAFVLVSNAIGSAIGAKAVNYIRQPKKVFLLIQGMVTTYSAIAVWLIGLYWQNNPQLRSDIGFIDLDNLTGAVFFKYLIVPTVMMVIPNLLLGFYFPLVQKAVQTDNQSIGKRVGYLMLWNIVGNTCGGLLTGLVLLDKLGTAASLRLLVLIGLGFVIAIRPRWQKAYFTTALTIVLVATALLFPSNNRLWAALHGVDDRDYFILAEDSTSTAAIAENNGKGVLLASGQVQANFPYLHIHGLLGTVPALLHPDPKDVMIIGLGSGGTPHTIGVNPKTERVQVVELLGAELPVLKAYSQTEVGKPLSYFLNDPRYEIIVGDGRAELILAESKFDIIEADAIQPWRSRAGMLYSQEFFREVRSRLKPGGFFVQWDVGAGTLPTMRSVFPFVTRVGMAGNLWVLIGSDRPVSFDRQLLISKLQNPQVVDYLTKAGFDIAAMEADIKDADVEMFSGISEDNSAKVNTDLFPRGEYYLNNDEG